MKCKFILSVAVILLSSISVLAQQSQSTDEVAIKRIVGYYFDGYKNSNAESMKKAFHPKAKWFVIRYGDLSEITQPKLQSNLRDNIRRGMSPSGENILMQVVSLDATRGAASVKVEIEYVPTRDPKLLAEMPFLRSTKVIEYLSLIKFGDEWKIVSKVLSEGEQQPEVAAK